MTKITVSVVGMACGMCEAHVNDAIRNAYRIKKVTSSHKKGETVIISEVGIDKDSLRQTIVAAGYKVTDVKYEPYEKRSLFSFGKK